MLNSRAKSIWNWDMLEESAEKRNCLLDHKNN